MKTTRLFFLTASLACLLLGSMPLKAEPTALRVLVRAVDAKFIGSLVGGLHVHVADVSTGEVLASGLIDGDTGDTPGLMTEGQQRGAAPVHEGDASFTAVLDIDQPRQLRVSVRGPLLEAQSAQDSSVTLWLVPGRDQVSPGIVLHMPGLLARLQSWEMAEDRLAVRAEVSMLCGCPIMAEGLWPAGDFTVMAQLHDATGLLGEAALDFTGQTNTFAGALPLPKTGGDYRLVVYGYQDSTGNTGVVSQDLRLP